jgi:cytochrome c-type biogenesis protein CcmF
MNDIQFQGEWLWAGTLGNVLIALAFASALFSVFAWYNAEKKTPEGFFSWQRAGRVSFWIHSLSIISIIALILFLLFNHRFEYYYVWQHSNKSMQMKYILSCLWEGQEGSFLLWMFWHVILGTVIMYSVKDWKAPVMFIVALVQVFLVSMIVGVVLEFPTFDYKIGSNPFMLLREHETMRNMPFVKIPDYLNKIDGRGLNPLLQNYWMTIHPPTLFLGFASTVVPFAFAIAGLWRRQFTEWIKPALPWTFFGVMILGLGILMGGAWAYEALSFGGFWAWDPVENASLVPWLTLVAGAHLMLVFRNKGTSLLWAFILIILSFVLILYSTFLTRSGVLGESSVHAFTDLGMSGQLLFYLLFFAWLPVVIFTYNPKLRINYLLITACLFILTLIFGFNAYITLGYLAFALFSCFLLVSNYKAYFPQNEKEDAFSSREFWMFMGALVLLLSAFQITVETSLPAFGKAFGEVPVLQKLFPSNITSSSEAIEIYNAWQIPFAVLIALLMGVGQFFRYRETDMKEWLKNMAFSLLLSAAVTASCMLFTDMFRRPFYFLLLFATIFAITANLDFLIRFVKFKWRLAAPSVAHVGFALIILGSLISAGHKKIISQNTIKAINLEALNADFRNNENILLQKGDTVPMGEYLISYRADSVSGLNVYTVIDYFQKNENGTLEKTFTLNPILQTNPRFGNVAEPSTRHFWDKDIYTHLTYISPEKVNKLLAGTDASIEEKTDEFREIMHHEIADGDTLYTTNCFIVYMGLKSLSVIDTTKGAENTRIDLQGKFIIGDAKGNFHEVKPGLSIVDNEYQSFPAMNEETGIKVEMLSINPEARKVEVSIQQKEGTKSNDFIIMKAIVFPGINLLWLGSVLMVIGSGMAVLAGVKRKLSA